MLPSNERWVYLQTHSEGYQKGVTREQIDFVNGVAFFKVRFAAQIAAIKQRRM